MKLSQDAQTALAKLRASDYVSLTHFPDEWDLGRVKNAMAGLKLAGVPVREASDADRAGRRTGGWRGTRSRALGRGRGQGKESRSRDRRMQWGVMD